MPYGRAARHHTLSCTKPSFPYPLDYSNGGELLPRLFTITRRLYIFCGTFHTIGFSPIVPIFQSGLCSVVSGLSSQNLIRANARCLQKVVKNKKLSTPIKELCDIFANIILFILRNRCIHWQSKHSLRHFFGDGQRYMSRQLLAHF